MDLAVASESISSVDMQAIAHALRDMVQQWKELQTVLARTVPATAAQVIPPGESSKVAVARAYWEEGYESSIPHTTSRDLQLLLPRCAGLHDRAAHLHYGDGLYFAVRSAVANTETIIGKKMGGA